MKHTCHYSQTLGRIVFFFVIALCASPSFTQDLQVMVSGPWSYVTDPVKYPGLLFLVAPGSSIHHNVYLLPGIDPKVPKNPNTPKPYPTATYRLTYQAPKGAYAVTDQNTPVLSGGAINSPATKVRPILENNSKNNYVIILPTPDGYTTYSGPMGSSESQQSNSHIPKANSAQVLQYTTWMVLHYGVSSLPDSFQVAGGTSISTKGSSPTTSGGISIVLAEEPNQMDPGLTCDNVSLESVQERNALWKVTQYARFPKENIDGTQQAGTYDYRHCSDSDPKVHPKYSFSAGSADCHTSQMSINSAIPGAITPTTVH